MTRAVDGAYGPEMHSSQLIRSTFAGRLSETPEARLQLLSTNFTPALAAIVRRWERELSQRCKPGRRVSAGLAGVDPWQELLDWDVGDP